MRTLISLLLLACFAWTQATVADCPMAPAPSGQAEHAAASASTHHGHHAPASAPAPGQRQDDPRHPPSPAQHLAGGCGVLAACGATAAPALASSLPAFDAPRSGGVAAGRDSYASPSLSTDPPPPRTSLRS